MVVFTAPQYYDWNGTSPMTFDRKQLVPLLQELLGRHAVQADYNDALEWLRDNLPALMLNTGQFTVDDNMGIICRRYDVALSRAAKGAKLCFYDRQLLEQLADALHVSFGETLFEGVAHA